MNKPHILIDSPPAPYVRQKLAHVGHLVLWSDAPETSFDHIQGLYTYDHLPVTDALLDRLPALRVVSNFGVGVDHIDLRAAHRRAIPVGHTPGVLDQATADLGFALLLASARRIVEGTRLETPAQGDVSEWGTFLGREVHSATLGIVGLGRIGRQVALRAAGFQMRILYHQPRPIPPDQLPAAAQHVGLRPLLEQSDYVILTLPLTTETHHLIDDQRLAWMRPSATLVNIARGPIVDTLALTNALLNGHLAAAALDVTDPEPLPMDHPLRHLPQVIITPHVGSATGPTRQRMADLSVENLKAGLEGRPLPAPVDSARR